MGLWGGTQRAAGVDSWYPGIAGRCRIKVFIDKTNVNFPMH